MQIWVEIVLLTQVTVKNHLISKSPDFYLHFVSAVPLTKWGSFAALLSSQPDSVSLIYSIHSGMLFRLLDGLVPNGFKKRFNFTTKNKMTNDFVQTKF